MKRISAWIIAGASAFFCQAAGPGLSLQGSPSGVIAGIELSTDLGMQTDLGLRLAVNVTDRGEDGEHEDEEGDGGGAGVWLRHRFTPHDHSWFVGTRVDVWAMTVDWTEEDGTEGSSDVLVVQPTVELGYVWFLESGRLLGLSLAGGAEINVDTDGEDVGEGGIGFLGMFYQW